MFQTFFNTSNIIEGAMSPLKDNDCTAKFNFNDDQNEVFSMNRLLLLLLLYC